jgi:DNA-binding CsgD family transcriptional regulator
MLLQRSSLGDNAASAVARLTAKERKCLDRWLGHATAKEIALDLGITHHAVEKRLKSARSKLGVTSTLEAARLLASVEGYGPTASQSPDVAATPLNAHDETVATPPPWWMQRRGQIIAGASVMSLIVLAALAVGSQTPSTNQAAGAPPPKIIMIERSTGAVRSGEAGFKELFERLDKNSNGFIDNDERTVRIMRPDGSAVDMASWDQNGDSRLSIEELQSGLARLGKS